MSYLKEPVTLMSLDAGDHFVHKFIFHGSESEIEINKIIFERLCDEYKELDLENIVHRSVLHYSISIWGAIIDNVPYYYNPGTLVKSEEKDFVSNIFLPKLLELIEDNDAKKCIIFIEPYEVFSFNELCEYYTSILKEESLKITRENIGIGTQFTLEGKESIIQSIFDKWASVELPSLRMKLINCLDWDDQ